MKIINLGCGFKTSSRSEVVNIDCSIYLRIKSNRLLRVLAPLVIKGERLVRFNSISKNIMIHNLIKGIPFDSNSVDVVYHSHLLEHFNRDFAKIFLCEAKRVLRTNGIHRIVVPDFEKVCRTYVSNISVSEADPDEANKHDSYIAAIIEQSVRREAFSTSQQKPLRRFIENLFLGDAQRRHEIHQWMYDKINLKLILTELGYKAVHIQDYNISLIPNWVEYGLDLDRNGNQYKPDSLYVEAVK